MYKHLRNHNLQSISPTESIFLPLRIAKFSVGPGDIYVEFGSLNCECYIKVPNME